MDIISHVIVTILLAETLVIKQTHTLPVPSERLQGKGNLATDVNPSSAEKTVSGVLEEMDKLEIKAVYKNDIELQSAVNKSEAVRDNKPQYILTKTQKIYFFSQPTLDSAKNLQLGGDGSKKVNQQNSQPTSIKSEDKNLEAVQELLKVAKKHTNNPPGWTLRSMRMSGDQHNVPKTTLDKAATMLSFAAKQEIEHSVLYTTTPQDYAHDKFESFLAVLRMYLNNGSPL